MPANLSPEYMKAEKEFRTAKTPEEKLACLQHMLSVIPKHKGTEKMQADLKRKISQCKEQIEQHAKKKGGHSYRVKPEGAGQIVLIGPPNSGKSALLAALTHAEPEIAEYPFTTREPIPGMMPYKDIHIQLVDLPPVSKEYCESFVFDNIRGADGALLIIDLAAPDPAQDYSEIQEILESKKIQLVQPETEIIPEKTGSSQIRTLLLLNKTDLDPSGELILLVRELMNTSLPFFPVSALNKIGFDSLGEELFRLLQVIRVYTKEPGKAADLKAPYTMPIGTNVLEFAGRVHKDFAEHLKQARIWGSARFDGQVVQRDHVLLDGDVIELSMH